MNASSMERPTGRAARALPPGAYASSSRSDPGSDTTRLPRAQGASSERRRNERPRVLVVDDNVDLAESLVTVLQIEGIDAVAAFDAPTAEQLAHDRRPTVVVSDLDMPLGDGFELAHRLHAAPDTRDIPVVAVSGWSDDMTEHDALRAGFARFIAKPFYPADLLAALRALLGRRRGDH